MKQWISFSSTITSDIADTSHDSKPSPHGENLPAPSPNKAEKAYQTGLDLFEGRGKIKLEPILQRRRGEDITGEAVDLHGGDVSKGQVLSHINSSDEDESKLQPPHPVNARNILPSSIENTKEFFEAMQFFANYTEELLRMASKEQLALQVENKWARINNNTKLKEYYCTLIKILNTTFAAAGVIYSGMVEHKLSIGASSGITVTATVVSEAAKHIPLPCSSIASTILKLSWQRAQKPKINSLSDFFNSDAPFQAESIRLLGQALTLQQADMLDALPSESAFWQKKYTWLKNTITGGDLDTPIRKQAATDAKVIIETIVQRYGDARMPRQYDEKWFYILTNMVFQTNGQQTIVSNRDDSMASADMHFVEREKKMLFDTDTQEKHMPHRRTEEEIKKLQQELATLKKQMQKIGQPSSRGNDHEVSYSGSGQAGQVQSQCLVEKVKPADAQHNSNTTTLSRQFDAFQNDVMVELDLHAEQISDINTEVEVLKDTHRAKRTCHHRVNNATHLLLTSKKYNPVSAKHSSSRSTEDLEDLTEKLAKCGHHPGRARLLAQRLKDNMGDIGSQLTAVETQIKAASYVKIDLMTRGASLFAGGSLKKLEYPWEIQEGDEYYGLLKMLKQTLLKLRQPQLEMSSGNNATCPIST